MINNEKSVIRAPEIAEVLEVSEGYVSVALGGGIPAEILKEVKRVEIIEPIKEAMKKPETAGMLVHIIARAIKTLIRFVSDLIRYNAVDKAVPGTEKFYEALDYSRASMSKDKDRGWER